MSVGDPHPEPPAAAPATDAARTRRRGAELHAALLDAAWEEMSQAGYANLTIEAVARRAHTGVAVLYRRWAGKDELILAALEHYREQRPVTAPDTGSLREDLLGLLRNLSRQRAAFFTVAMAGVWSGLLTSSRLSAAQLRRRAVGPTGRSEVLMEVYRRAHERGEIDLDSIPDAVLDVPGDLVRYDLLMNGRPLPEPRLAAIIDDVFLPLVRATATDSAPSGTDD